MKNNPLQLDRRQALGFLAGAGLSVAVASAQTTTACLPLTSAMEEGPDFIDEKLLRSDIRTDPSNGAVQPGTPLTLTLTLQNTANGVCAPLAGAYVDIWQANWNGLFSDEALQGTAGQKFLRGYQISDSNGTVQFTTVYPGWYSGRAVHLHVRVRTYNGATVLSSFETQLFFDDTITDTVQATAPYNSHGTRDTRNAQDRVYLAAGTAASQNVLALAKTATGYAGSLTLSLNLQAPAITPGTTSYSLPQFAFGGGWYTAIYLSNTTNAAVTAQVNFLDTSGGTLSVPLVGLGSASSQAVSIGANSTIELQATSVNALQQGWVEVMAPAGVVGYAVLRQSVVGRADQEAVVPLSTETSQAADMVFDNINTTTGLAVANPTNQPVTVNVVAYNVNGTQVGASTISLSARSQTAVTLSSLSGMSAVAGQLGRVALTTNNGYFTALGLRFGAQAFTSIPVTYR